MVKLQDCVVKELETCEDPTPANIADSLFNFVKRVTPCEKLLGIKKDFTINSFLSSSPASSSSSSFAYLTKYTILSTIFALIIYGVV